MDYIHISTLNDFIFCPYSIYLHNVYMESDEMMFHAEPQTRGRISHEAIDHKTYSNRANDIISLCHVFFDAMIPYKIAVFKYVQSYYRCFMGSKSVVNYPSFNL